MSSFNLQKSFEKSLRTQEPILTTLKPEIHKSCTGKAHACGSAKISSLPKNPLVTTKLKERGDSKTLRKNSLSSETVSDSGSEISSWNSNKDSSAPSLTKPLPTIQKPLIKRTKSVNGASNCSSSTVRRRTSDSIIFDVPDHARNEIRRARLMSDGGGDKSNGQVEDISRLKRTSSFRTKSIPPLIPPKPKVAQALSTPNKSNGSFNNRLRNSFRNKNPIFNWNTIWESSFASKLGGGKLKVLDVKLLDKVNDFLGNAYLVKVSQ